jgi:predicted dehydrogenase
LLRIGLVGCGKIADAHAAIIRHLPECEIVGVCDREPLMARQLYERYPVKACYDGLTEFLTQARPDVVHVTTPPASHFDVAKQCLEAGCHVYVEKPFAINGDEVRQLIALAEKVGCHITAGHDDQFRPAARRMRALVQSGFLGEGPLHMESYFGYELSRAGYAGAMLGDKEHWVRKLPGKLLHNVISHGVARIAEFLTTDSPQVVAHGFASPFLRSMGVTDIIDELRVIVSEEQRVTAYFTFSSQMRPSLHQFRAYGSKNGLILDQDQETLIRLRGAKLKSYAEPFFAPMIFAKQYMAGAFRNMGLFLARDFHMKAGMKHLIERFYRSITAQTPVPIPYREILLTATIMDKIFAQLDAQQRQLASDRHEGFRPMRENQALDEMAGNNNRP